MGHRGYMSALRKELHSLHFALAACEDCNTVAELDVSLAEEILEDTSTLTFKRPRTHVCLACRFLQTAKATFTFQEAVDWLAQHDSQQQQAKPAEQSRALQQLSRTPIEKLSALQQLQLITVVQPPGVTIQTLQGRHEHAVLLRLTRDCPWATPGQALNGHLLWHGKARPAVEVKPSCLQHAVSFGKF